MNTSKPTQGTDLSRRKALASLSAIAGTSVLAITGCGGGGSKASSSAPSPAAPSPSTPATPPSTTPQSSWAAGGTKSLTVNVPPANPFSNAGGSMCQITEPFTLGPCYFNPDEVRQDISEGEAGVPMIVALRIVDRNCNPLSAIEVEIWHCDKDGAYSGNSSESSDATEFDVGFCTGTNSKAKTTKWFRGTQITDSDGIVYFTTCFPGWYPGRTTHIHLQLKYNNVKSLVSQLAFEDTLSNQIHQDHSDYKSRGQKDTTNTNDDVFSNNLASHVFSSQRNDDNSMMVWKTIQVTSL